MQVEVDSIYGEIFSAMWNLCREKWISFFIFVRVEWKISEIVRMSGILLYIEEFFEFGYVEGRDMRFWTQIAG